MSNTILIEIVMYKKILKNTKIIFLKWKNTKIIITLDLLNKLQ